jgi:hypothetical protein
MITQRGCSSCISPSESLKVREEGWRERGCLDRPHWRAFIFHSCILMQAATLPGYVWEPDRKHKSWWLQSFEVVVPRQDDLPLADVINNFRSFRNICAREMCRLLTAAVSDGERGRSKTATTLWEKSTSSRHGHTLRRTQPHLLLGTGVHKTESQLHREQPLFSSLYTHFITKRTA